MLRFLVCSLSVLILQQGDCTVILLSVEIGQFRKFNYFITLPIVLQILKLLLLLNEDISRDRSGSP